MSSAVPCMFELLKQYIFENLTSESLISITEPKAVAIFCVKVLCLIEFFSPFSVHISIRANAPSKTALFL